MSVVKPEQIEIPKSPHFINEPGNPNLDPIEIVEMMFDEAVKIGASDIHIEPLEKNIIIRFRVDGEFIAYALLHEELKQPIVARIKILGSMKIDENRIPQDGKAVITTVGKSVDLRVNVLPTIYGEKICTRILEKDESTIGLDVLGFLPHSMEMISQALKKTYGIILTTGPTGSGKSTTLYSMLAEYNPLQVNISTLEDPVEARMLFVNQSQTKHEIGFDFKMGLKALVRQDPDIILVGEIRDEETANLAIEAAITGHLVFGTIHTNTASSTVQRLKNMGVDNFLISAALQLICSQKLARRICPDCKKQASLSPGVLKMVENHIGGLVDTSVDQIPFYEPVGCEKCNNLGYKGRVGFYEIMSNSTEIEELINKNRPSSEIEAQAIKEGMILILQDALLKAAMGMTSVDEAFKSCGISSESGNNDN